MKAVKLQATIWNPQKGDVALLLGPGRSRKTNGGPFWCLWPFMVLVLFSRGFAVRGSRLLASPGADPPRQGVAWELLRRPLARRH